MKQQIRIFLIFNPIPSLILKGSALAFMLTAISIGVTS